jgi:hypothetical protein
VAQNLSINSAQPVEHVVHVGHGGGQRGVGLDVGIDGELE